MIRTKNRPLMFLVLAMVAVWIVTTGLGNAAEQPIRWKGGSCFGLASPLGKNTILLWKENVEKMSGGRMVIEVHDGWGGQGAGAGDVQGGTHRFSFGADASRRSLVQKTHQNPGGYKGFEDQGRGPQHGPLEKIRRLGGIARRWRGRSRSSERVDRCR